MKADDQPQLARRPARRKPKESEPAAAPAKRKRGRGSVGPDAIIQATRELLRETTPANLSRKSVAEAANVDPALVRYYFSDLSHLLTEVLKLLVKEYREKFDALEIDPAKPREALAKRIHHIVSFLANEPSYHDLFIEQIVNGQDEWARETRDNFTDSFFGSMNRLIGTGRKEGLFREDFDPQFVYIAIIGAAHFLATSRPIFERLFGKDRRPSELSEEYAEFLTQVILNGLASPKAQEGPASA